MPSARVLRVTVTILLVALPLAGSTPVVGTVGDTAAVPHEAPDDPDGNVTVLRGYGSLFETTDDLRDLRRARANGDVRPTTHLVQGELLVLQFSSERATEKFEGTEGSDTTDRFFRMLNATDVNVSVEERNHGAERPAGELDLNGTNTVVLHDSGNGTFALLVDTGNVTLVERDGGEPIRHGVEYLDFEAVVEIPTGEGRRTLVGGSEFHEPIVALQSPNPGVHLAQIPATVRRNATNDLTLNGTATLLPGTNLTVSTVAPDGSVLAERQVRTQESQSASDQFGHSVFRTTLDVGPLGADEEFDLVISKDQPIDERRVVVGSPPRMWNTTAELVADGKHEGQVEVSATLDLPADGFLLVYVDGEPVTTPVSSDSRVRKTMYIDQSAIDREQGEVYVLAVWDTDGDGTYDESDRLFGTSVDVGASRQDSELDASVPVEGWPRETSTTASDSTSTTSPGRASTETSPTATTGTSTTTETTATTTTATPSMPVSIPGFGAVAAVTAVASAVLFRVRRS